jgi:hypothetical protein
LRRRPQEPLSERVVDLVGYGLMPNLV